MTESRPERAPAGINLDQPGSARVWDRLVPAVRVVSDEDDPRAVVATPRDAMAAGSHLIVQHASHGGQSGGISKTLPMWSTDSPEPMYWRTRDEIESLFEGAAQNPERYASYAAVGTKPPVTTG